MARSLCRIPESIATPCSVSDADHLGGKPRVRDTRINTLPSLSGEYVSGLYDHWSRLGNVILTIIPACSYSAFCRGARDSPRNGFSLDRAPRGKTFLKS